MLMAIRGRLRDVSVALSCGAAADVACQALERRRHESKDTLSLSNLDRRRTFAFATFTGLYIGGFCHGVYSLYPRLARYLLKRSPSPREEGAIATVVDNFIHVPALYIPSFYLGTSFLRGEDATSGLAGPRVRG